MTFAYSKWRLAGQCLFFAGSIGVAVWMWVLVASGAATFRGGAGLPFAIGASVLWSMLALFAVWTCCLCLRAPFAVKITDNRLQIAGPVGFPPRLVVSEVELRPGLGAAVYFQGITFAKPVEISRSGAARSVQGLFVMWKYIEGRDEAQRLIVEKTSP